MSEGDRISVPTDWLTQKLDRLYALEVTVGGLLGILGILEETLGRMGVKLEGIAKARELVLKTTGIEPRG